MKQLKIFSRDRIFVALAQKTELVGIFEILKFRRIASEFLVVGANGPRILDTAVDHLLFAIALDVEGDRGHDDAGRNDHQSDDQQQDQQDVALLTRAAVSTNL